MLRSPLIRIPRRCFGDVRRKSHEGLVVKKASKRLGSTLRRREELENENSPDGSQALTFPYIVDNENQTEMLKNLLMPLRDTSYEAQLELKNSVAKNSLRELGKNLMELGVPTRLDVHRMPCVLNPIVPAPEQYFWRHEINMSAWRSVDGTKNVVGLNLFATKKYGDTACVPPTDVTIFRAELLKTTEILNEFIQNESQTPAHYVIENSQGWRQFNIRTNDDGHVMVIGMLSPSGLSVKAITAETELFRQFLRKRTAELDVNLTSLYIRLTDDPNALQENIPFTLLHGDPTLSVNFLGRQLNVSPGSKMPLNLHATEQTVKTLRQLLEDCYPQDSSTGKKPIIVDTSACFGAHACSLSDMAQKFIGIQWSPQSIGDCQANATANGVENTEFICEQPEIVLEALISKMPPSAEVVYISGARGKRGNTANILRDLPQVKRLIHMFDPTVGPKTDFIGGLCKKLHGRRPPPFMPVFATALDTAPQARRLNVILTLERAPQ